MTRMHRCGVRKGRGFTLVEVLIVVAIVAILASVAYPTYLDQVRKSRRADAKTVVLEVLQAQERHFTNCGAYTTNLTAASTCAADGLGYPADPIVTDGGWYQVTVQACGADPLSECIQVDATGQDDQADAPCANLLADSRGVRTATDSGGTDTTNLCW